MSTDDHKHRSVLYVARGRCAILWIGQPLLQEHAMMRTIEATIDIEASAEAVWTIVMDWPGYPSWNPFIRAITGNPKVGERIHVRIGLPVGTVPINATVTRLKPEAEIVWHSALPFSGLFDRDHAITLVTRPNGCRLIQTQTFDGTLVPALSIVADGLARSGLKRMNSALKIRVESMNPRAMSSGQAS